MTVVYTFNGGLPWFSNNQISDRRLESVWSSSIWDKSFGISWKAKIIKSYMNAQRVLANQKLKLNRHFLALIMRLQIFWYSSCSQILLQQEMLVLSLAENKLKGTIPEDIGDMLNLKQSRLHNNQQRKGGGHSGILPSMENLVYLSEFIMYYHWYFILSNLNLTCVIHFHFLSTKTQIKFFLMVIA